MLNILSKMFNELIPSMLKGFNCYTMIFPGDLPILLILTTFETFPNVKLLVFMVRSYPAAGIFSVLNKRFF